MTEKLTIEISSEEIAAAAKDASTEVIKSLVVGVATQVAKSQFDARAFLEKHINLEQLAEEVCERENLVRLAEAAILQVQQLTFEGAQAWVSTIPTQRVVDVIKRKIKEADGEALLEDVVRGWLMKTAFNHFFEPYNRNFADEPGCLNELVTLAVKTVTDAVVKRNMEEL